MGFTSNGPPIFGVPGGTTQYVIMYEGAQVQQGFTADTAAIGPGDFSTTGTNNLSGPTIFYDTVEVRGSLTLASGCTLVLNGQTITSTGALTLTGAGTALSITNNATVGGTLGVTGTSTLGAIASSGLVTFTSSGNALTVSNNAIIGGTLSLTGVFTSGTTNSSGVLTLSSAGTALVVTNNATIGGTLGVTGTSTLGVVNASGLLGINGGANVPTGQNVTYATGSTITYNGQNLSTTGTLGCGAITSTGTSTIGGASSCTITSTSVSINDLRAASSVSSLFCVGRGALNNSLKFRYMSYGSTSITISAGAQTGQGTASSTITITNLGTATTGGTGTNLTTGGTSGQTCAITPSMHSSTNSFPYSLSFSSLNVGTTSTTFVINAYQIPTAVLATASADTIVVDYVFYGW